MLSFSAEHFNVIEAFNSSSMYLDDLFDIANTIYILKKWLIKTYAKKPKLNNAPFQRLKLSIMVKLYL